MRIFSLACWVVLFTDAQAQALDWLAQRDAINSPKEANSFLEARITALKNLLW